MSVPFGRLQFFALEATDYLERLAMLVGRPAGPDGEELVRLTRALRGAGLMAGLSRFSEASAALEQVAKAYRVGQWVWSSERTEGLAAAVEELKSLARKAADWSEAEDAAAKRLAISLVGALSREESAHLRTNPDELPASVRAYVAREGAQIAGTLEQAARAIEVGRPAAAADAVVHRLQALRGLAALPALSPLPELLDAIELTMRRVPDGGPAASAPAALRKVAAALTAVARDIVDHGRASVDSPEAVAGARALLETFTPLDDTVGIEELFADGDENPIVTRGVPPGPATPTDSLLTWVSATDRLRQAAGQLEGAGSVTSRTLYFYALATELEPLARGATADRPELRALAAAIIRAVATGRADSAPFRFTELLRRAADGSEPGELVVITGEFGLFGGDRPRQSLAGVTEEALALEPQAGDEDDDSPIVPIESLAPDGDLDSDVVPVESLAPDGDEVSAIVPIESLAPETPPVARVANAFALSFSTYHRLLQERMPAATEPDLDVRLPEPGVVPIETLLFRGRRALERADAVRLELSRILESRPDFDQIEPLVSELIDLVPLALAE